MTISPTLHEAQAPSPFDVIVQRVQHKEEDLVFAERYTREPYPVTEVSEHPRATVKPTPDGRWRAVLWEAPSVAMTTPFLPSEVTFPNQADAIHWASHTIAWERSSRR